MADIRTADNAFVPGRPDRRRAEKRKESAAPMPFKGKGVDVYPSEEEHKALLEG